MQRERANEMAVYRALGRLAKERRANGFARGATLLKSSAPRGGRLPCARPRRINLFFPFFCAAPGFFPGKNHWRLRTQLGKPRCHDPQKHQCRDHKKPQCLHSKKSIARLPQPQKHQCLHSKTPLPQLKKTPMPALENLIACTPDVGALSVGA